VLDVGSQEYALFEFVQLLGMAEGSVDDAKRLLDEARNALVALPETDGSTSSCAEFTTSANIASNILG